MIQDAEVHTCEPHLLRVKDACRLLGIGRTKAFELIGQGRLEAVKLDGATRITSASVRQLVANLSRVVPKGGAAT